MFEHTILYLRHTLADDTSGPKDFQSFLREVNLLNLDDISATNLVERICTFEIEVDITFSVFYMRLFILLNEIHKLFKRRRKRSM